MIMETFFKKILRFSRAQEGIAYLEFAITMPFLLAMLMGSVEMTRYILIAQKVEKAAASISDLVAQGQTVSNSDLNNIILAAGQVMQPYSFDVNGYVIISSVTQTGPYSASNLPRVNWQYTGGGSWVQPSQVGVPGSAANLPAGMTLNDKDNVIVTEVFYNYQPMLANNGIIAGSPLYKVAVFKPRLGDLTTLSFLLPYSLYLKGAVL